MARYIDAGELKRTIRDRTIMPKWCKVLVNLAINEQPTADVAPVVHAHLRRESGGKCKGQLRCSVCHCTTSFWDDNLKSPYCPWCGAKMDEEAE